MIAIQALTGIHPTRLNTDPQSGNPLWQATIEPRLEQFLQKLTAFHFNQRHPSATEAQQALHASYTNVGTTLIPLEDSAQASPIRTRIQTVPPKKLLPIAILGIGTILATLWATQRLPWPIVNQSANVIDAPSLQISSGEKIFNPIANNPQKQSAANHMQARQFKQAIVDLKAARIQDRSDPEVLIHLHNAEIGDRPAYKIAVVVPLKDRPNFANEVLRGIAQAQDQVNSAGGIAGKPIKITLADDGNQPESAQQIARSFVQDPEILGVIGHGVSQTTYAAADIYKAGELPVVSPLSSAEKLSEFKQHLFRTIPSDRRSAKQLADYAVKHLKKTRIAVFYNAEDAYSTSLKEAFKDALDYGYDKKLLETIDINQSEFDAGERLTALKQKKVEIIFLATNFDRFKDAMTIVQANDQQLPILAGETFYSKQTLNVGKKDVVGMVIAVPAQQVTLNSSNFQTVARQLWGIPVTWRSALGYDATQAILAGLRQSPTRQGIRATLANPKFQTTGATQKVQFEDTGDRSSPIQLIQVVMPPKQPTPSFKPIQP
jgi:eukaryotic-like serine/threonine-protein kinase